MVVPSDRQGAIVTLHCGVHQDTEDWEDQQKTGDYLFQSHYPAPLGLFSEHRGKVPLPRRIPESGSRASMSSGSVNEQFFFLFSFKKLELRCQFPRDRKPPPVDESLLRHPEEHWGCWSDPLDNSSQSKV